MKAIRQLGDEAKGEKLQILLTHDPSHWRAEVVSNTDIPLTLSGHTHAGQMRILGYPLSSLMFTESEGWYEMDGQSLYINTGIGCTLPVRVGVPAEITVITLKKN
jgi:predicted MPP superfamily phosphohydrolase